MNSIIVYADYVVLYGIYIASTQQFYDYIYYDTTDITIGTSAVNYQPVLWGDYVYMNSYQADKLALPYNRSDIDDWLYRMMKFKGIIPNT